MNDFLKDLFVAAARRKQDALAEYEDDDLNNFFDEARDEPKQALVEMARQILDNLESQNLVGDYCRRTGLSAKSLEKVQVYVKKNKSELAALKSFGFVEGDDRYLGMSWAVRSVFFSRKDEFKNQKKYAVLNVDVSKNEGKEKLVLTCSKEGVLRIKDKLAELDKEIRAMFGNEGNSQ
jgi:hypothetical protein